MRLPRTRRTAIARTTVRTGLEPRARRTRSARDTRRTRRTALAAVALASVAVLAAAALPAQASGPAHTVPAQANGPAGHGPLRARAVAAYDFGHPDPADPARERDIGRSGTPLTLINGGSAMRVDDEAYRGSSPALQVRQQNPPRRATTTGKRVLGTRPGSVPSAPSTAPRPPPSWAGSR